MSINSCTFKGRIGRDAVTRYTQAVKPATAFPMAVDIGWGDNKSTLWLDCTIWGERGEKLAPHLVKGSQPTVIGELGTREHEGKTYITLNVREIDPEWQSAGASTGGGHGGSRGGAPQRQRPQPATAAAVDEFEDDTIPFIRWGDR